MVLDKTKHPDHVDNGDYNSYLVGSMNVWAPWSLNHLDSDFYFYSFYSFCSHWLSLVHLLDVFCLSGHFFIEQYFVESQ